jgi:hypothetical protein
MKIIFTFLISLSLSQYSIAQGYQVTLQALGYQSGIAYLTYHMGKNLNTKDSTATNKKSFTKFKDNSTVYF